MFEICRHCPAPDWCRNRGCIAWNDVSRERYYEAKRRSKQSNDEIDKLEQLLKSDDL